MTRAELIGALADWYGIEPDENGEYDLTDYDWEAGCSFDGAWLSLANIVACLTTYCTDGK